MPRAVDVVVYEPYAGPLYTGEGVAGGAELQSVYVARSLARAGLKVRHIVASAPPTVTDDGVELIALPQGYAARGITRRRAIVHALHRADGVAYIQRCAGMETGVVGAFARATRRRFVYSASSDGDFMRDRAALARVGGSLEEWPTRLQYRLGLRCVDVVVAQTEGQARLAHDNFGLAPRVIRSFAAPAAEPVESGDYFLWIGTIAPVKNPHAFLALAQRLPELRFVMVAPAHQTHWADLAAAVHARAASLANVDLLSPRPRDELLKLYDSAIAVVNTSEFEGFPNTFLEAWSRGIPAVSLRVDPDGVISRHGLGATASGSPERLTEAVHRYASTPELARTAGKAALAYIEHVHAPSVVGPEWVSLLESLLSSPRN